MTVLQKRNSFEDYFEDDVEYPDSCMMVDDILPRNVMLNYVSSSFLNGFINYVKIIRVWLLRRYTLPSSEEGEYTISIAKEDKTAIEHLSQASLVSDDGYWLEYSFTCFDDFIKAWLESDHFHVKFSELHDDVVVLARSASHYWFFWFDLDCSDCSVGRFQTEDPEDLVIEKFDQYVRGIQYSENKHYQEKADPILIPVEKLKGWLSS